MSAGRFDASVPRKLPSPAMAAAPLVTIWTSCRDGTVAPWVVVASLTFVPEIVLPTLEHFNEIEIGVDHPYGLEATFNPTFPDEKCRDCGWVSPWHFGINQGPIVLMIENYCTQSIWKLMRHCPYIRRGLQRAGFSGGWLYHRHIL